MFLVLEKDTSSYPELLTHSVKTEHYSVGVDDDALIVERSHGYFIYSSFEDREPSGQIKQAIDEFDPSNASDSASRLFKEFPLNFNLIYVSRAEPLLLVISDVSGSTPFFYSDSGDTFAASDTVSLILDLRQDIKVDLAAINENLRFRTPLGHRTQFSEVNTILPGSVLSRNDGQLDNRRWYRYPEKSVEAVAPEDVFNSLRSAVERRIGDAPDYCLVSAGMDSRFILYFLSQIRPDITLLNFGIPGTLDYEIPKKIASQFGFSLSQHHSGARAAISRGGLAGIVRDHFGHADAPVSIWTGDDGSISLGGVYLPTTAEGCRKPIEAFLTNRKIRGPSPYDHEGSNAVNALHEQLELSRALGSGSDLNALFVFLVENMQRRHVWPYLSLRKNLFFKAPFMDGAFLDDVFKVPTECLMRHEFYNRVFDLLPEDWKAIPVQTYPEHIPLRDYPLEAYESQWEDKRPLNADLRFTRGIAASLVKAVLGGELPQEIDLRRLLADLSKWSMSPKRRTYIMTQYAPLVSAIKLIRSSS